MAFVIQIVVAGLMLVAWVWLLGRPALSAAASASSADRHEGDGDIDFWGRDSSWRRVTAKTGRLGKWWWGMPVERRRRQLLLATMIATFVSFFLAIALKGRFGYLFVMMLTLLVAHLAIASRVGSRLVRDQRARAHAAAVARAQVTTNPEDIHIRATGVVTLLGPEDEAETIGVTSYVSDLISEAWADEPSSDGAERAAAESDLASQLEWADEASSEPSSSGLAETTTVPAAEAEPVDEPTAEKPAARAIERIFTRAAKDGRTAGRGRRKPQPIHIESDLDDDLDLQRPAAKAVNQN
jgi:hypothetical protein